MTGKLPEVHKTIHTYNDHKSTNPLQSQIWLKLKPFKKKCLLKGNHWLIRPFSKCVPSRRGRASLTKPFPESDRKVPRISGDANKRYISTCLQVPERLKASSMPGSNKNFQNDFKKNTLRQSEITSRSPSSLIWDGEKKSANILILSCHLAHYLMLVRSKKSRWHVCEACGWFGTSKPRPFMAPWTKESALPSSRMVWSDLYIGISMLSVQQAYFVTSSWPVVRCWKVSGKHQHPMWWHIQQAKHDES